MEPSWTFFGHLWIRARTFATAVFYLKISAARVQPYLLELVIGCARGLEHSSEIIASRASHQNIPM